MARRFNDRFPRRTTGSRGTNTSERRNFSFPNPEYSSVQLAAALASFDLQQAYDNDTAVPQIVVDGTPDPLTIDASVAGDVFAVRDAAALDLLRLGTTAGALYGGNAAGTILDLQGANNSPDVGIARINSPVTFTYDTFSNTTPAQQFVLNWGPTVSIPGTYVGGMLQTAAVFNISTGVFVPAIFSDTNRYNIGANPAFSAITFINELSVVANDGNFNLPSGLVMNVGLVHERNTSGTSTTVGTTGVSFSPQTRATVPGAVMTKTTQIGMTVTPTYSTVSGATANLGTIIGVQMNNPIVALFQPGSGVENVTAVYGLVMNNMTTGGSGVTRAAVLSGLAAGPNNHFLKNNSTAQSDMGTSHIYFDDGFGIAMGGNGIGAFDVWLSWVASGYYRTFFNTASASSLRWSNPALNRFLFDNDGGSTTGEYNWNCAKFSLGAQTGSVGNQVGVFVAGTRSTLLNGDWSDFLLTQAGNITINHSMGTVSGWTINAPSITLGTGTVTHSTSLLIGGNPGAATTDRTGVRIISNPSGGAGVNAALYVTVGRTQLNGILAHGGTTLGFYNATPVAQSAAYSPTNVATDRAYNANSTTVNELADVLGTLIADLQATGIIG